MRSKRLPEVLNRNIGNRASAGAFRQLDGRVVSLTVEGSLRLFLTPEATGCALDEATTATRTRACRALRSRCGTCRSAAQRVRCAVAALNRGRRRGGQKFRELLAQAQPDFERTRPRDRRRCRTTGCQLRARIPGLGPQAGVRSDQRSSSTSEEEVATATRTENRRNSWRKSSLRDDAERLGPGLARLESRGTPDARRGSARKASTGAPASSPSLPLSLITLQCASALGDSCRSSACREARAGRDHPRDTPFPAAALRSSTCRNLVRAQRAVLARAHPPGAGGIGPILRQFGQALRRAAT